jgi:hypothetical protein
MASFDLRGSENGLLQFGIFEITIDQGGILEIRVFQIAGSEINVFDFGFSEGGVSEVGLGKIDIHQFRFVETGT